MSLLDLASVVKDYRALRPLRIERLSLEAGDGLAILGLDQPAAEVFVNLVTGAAMPDTGDIRLFGQPTTSIKDAEEWLSIVDRFGIVTPRAVFLEGLSVIQNLALPLSIDIEPPPEAVRACALGIAREVGLSPDEWERRVGDVEPTSRVRVGLGRALALNPEVVLMEHPTAAVPQSAAAALGRDLRRIIERRGAAALTLTADPEFAAAVAPRVLTHEPATGRLIERRKRWFGRR